MLNFKYRCTPTNTHKRKGSITVLFLAVLLTITIISTSLVTIAQATFSSTNSSKIALQAQQYADAKAEILKATKYENITAHERSIIDNSIYQDEVLVDFEKPYPGNEDILQKECTINVYRLNEEHPRYSLKVVRTSVSLIPGVPIGGVIPWYGNIAAIPDGFLLCNGENGTPNLCGRFIVGAGMSPDPTQEQVYTLGFTGGENTVKLEADQSVSHFHYFGYNGTNNNGQWPCLRDSAIIPKYPTVNGVVPSASKWNGSGGGNWWGWDRGNSSYLLSNLVTSVSYGLDASEPHENRPPYYALYYIMRVE